MRVLNWNVTCGRFLARVTYRSTWADYMYPSPGSDTVTSANQLIAEPRASLDAPTHSSGLLTTAILPASSRTILSVMVVLKNQRGKRCSRKMGHERCEKIQSFHITYSGVEAFPVEVSLHISCELFSCPKFVWCLILLINPLYAGLGLCSIRMEKGKKTRLRISRKRGKSRGVVLFLHLGIKFIL